MKFKYATLEAEFMAMPERLQEIAYTFERLSKMFGIEPMVTRIKEKVPGSSGVHEAGRAIDFRDEHAGKFLYTLAQRNALLSFLNAMYPRSDGKKVCIWHSFRGDPCHFHIQIQKEWLIKKTT